MKIERRYIAHELRVAKSDDGGEKIVGYAAKFAPNAKSEDLGGFIEELHPNCFDRCLIGSPDVRALWNHDANHILGRTTAGTLKLGVDATGLHYEVTPPDTTTARDLMVSMKRGDVTQSSFGFICTDDSWREDPISGQYIRTVLQAELFDVSPVTFPAYPDATSGVRSEVRAMSEGSQTKLKELRAATELRKATEAAAATEPVATVEVAAEPVVEEQRTEAEVAVTEETPVVAAEEVRSDEQQEEKRCECDCQACLDGDCGNCTDDDCDDEFCCDCGMRAARAAKVEAETRAAAEAEAAEDEDMLLNIKLLRLKVNKV